MMPETPADDEQDCPLCTACAGSGEGLVADRCSSCGGGGYEPTSDEESALLHYLDDLDNAR